ncbi:MAG: hypothetical protein ACP5HK_00925 [Acidilobus sp.]
MKPKVLYVSSSVGLGHVTRDYRLSRLLDWAEITWLTAGKALQYLLARGERVHELSHELTSLGGSIMNVIRDCSVRYGPMGLLRLYRDLRRNSDLIRGNLRLDDYDLVIGDEPWELMMSGLDIPRRSALITDITYLGGREGLVYGRLNSWLKRRFRAFTLRFNVGLWARDEEFLTPGQLATHEDYPGFSEGGPVVINIGGTDVGDMTANSLVSFLGSRGLKAEVIGGSRFRPDPAELIARASALVVLAGYSSLVEVAFLRKRAVILKITGHFEHEENARVFEGRDGYRVLSCDKARPEEVYKSLIDVLRERPDPPQVRDASSYIASTIRRLAEQGD